MRLRGRSLQGLPAFSQPDLRWWQRRRVAAADATTIAELRHLERRLTLEEVAHFRCGISSVSSVRRCLFRDAAETEVSLKRRRN